MTGGVDCSFLLSGLVGGVTYVLLTIADSAPVRERAAADSEAAAALTVKAES